MRNPTDSCTTLVNASRVGLGVALTLSSIYFFLDFNSRNELGVGMAVFLVSSIAFGATVFAYGIVALSCRNDAAPAVAANNASAPTLFQQNNERQPLLGFQPYEGVVVHVQPESQAPAISKNN